MTFLMDEQEAERIEKLASEAELSLSEEDARKDLKERRGAIKKAMYDGSKKLKHAVPKGKHV